MLQALKKKTISNYLIVVVVFIALLAFGYFEFGSSITAFIHGSTGKYNSDDTLLVIALGVLIVAAFLYITFLQFSGAYLKDIKNYINSTPNPEQTMKRLDAFYENTPEEYCLKMDEDGILYTHSGTIWYLPAEEVVWAYPLSKKNCGVDICSASEKPKVRRHHVFVSSEEDVNRLLHKLQENFPYLLIGYNDNIDSQYEADPKALHQAVVKARNEAAEAPEEDE